MNLTRSSLRHPQVVHVLTLIVCIAGIQALVRMPRREDPRITVRQGLVLAAYPGATAEQVEEQVTQRIEQTLFGFAEVKKADVKSISMPGGVVINVWLEAWVEDADGFWSKLRHDLNELRVTSLPQGVLGPIVNSEFGDVVAVLLAVRGERYGYNELQHYLERIEAELIRLPAVSKVNRIGLQPERIYVTSTTQRIAHYGITPLQVVGSLQQRNVITEAGAFDADNTRARLHTTHYYQTEDQIRRQIVGFSPRGAAIYLGDFADVERRYADPQFLVRANGTPALMLTLEMHEGNNIVEFGHEIDATLERLREELPPDLEVTAIADQPKVVEERIDHFLREFGIALFAVIVATMILLPFQVAAMAATAIPVTIAVSFAMMQALGIELHQVSLAGMIVVLGMVVDDAIVIADNYVEMLDRGIDREEAAWRSASDLAVPVLAATLTIIASFLPLALLPGSTGEFILALPLTVAIALGSSYVVAMLLTPILCRTFIRQGLHAKHTETAGKQKFNMLDAMQAVYDRILVVAMRRKALTLVLGLLAVLAGVALRTMLDERFFPPAERDQFAINVWLPEGSRLEATDAAVRAIEGRLAADPEVTAYASFIGRGGPRFFLSFEPALPRPNIAQILVNTTSAEATPAVVSRMTAGLPAVVPQAEVQVQELEQGSPSESPVEIRLSGADLTTLAALGVRVQRILEGIPVADLVRTDFREDSYALEVDLNPEVASRLGMTNTLVSNLLAGTLLGMPVSTYWEGDRAVEIVLRLDESKRDSFEDIGSTYLVSPVARVPLRGIAELRPVWQRSRIVHRNGARTLTVGAFPEHGVLPSEVLGAAMPVLDTLTLPPGYRLSYGGEYERQQQTFGPMLVALAISLLSIFLILLFQFQSAGEALVVMASIPLALFGAMFGLFVTRNPFGFTAFIGLISLTGVVVRNAIILIDYINVMRREGVALEQAALEAGKRRLRPIFLTTMAAAAGLTPMILSGSGLWAPLASVIAVGLIFSMAFTLVVVPVLYVLTTRARPQSAPA